MDKIAILNLGRGDLRRGFPSVTVQLQSCDHSIFLKIEGNLPKNLKLAKLIEDWRRQYSISISKLFLRSDIKPDIEIEISESTRFSEVEFTQICLDLEVELNQWLNSAGFARIDRQLRTKLHSEDCIQVTIEADGELQKMLPWHLWNFFEHYPNAEVTLGTQEYEKVPAAPLRPRKKVRILAILGNSQGIHIERDRQLLEQMPDTEIHFLLEPTRQEVAKALWDDQGWDVLFFAGHSESQQHLSTGRIEINSTEGLTIPQLKNALKAAMVRGLKLAIFNSCDGLGLARDLADLHIPRLIVMRAPVPDQVAHEFLTSFLKLFAQGKSFYLAVREARERLQGLENMFPCASWLPVICQNPGVEPLTWNALLNNLSRSLEPERRSIDLSIGSQLLKGTFTSIAVTSIIFGMRWFGLLQPLELKAFDHLMTLRPHEGQDSRLMVIEITEEDTQELQQAPISDQVIVQLLQKIEPYDPKVVGLDIYRDFPQGPDQGQGYEDLVQHIAQHKETFAVCKVSSPEDGFEGYPPPRKTPESQVGFSDFVDDNDFILRRQLLAMGPPPNSPCQASTSFNLALALFYLEQEGIPPLELLSPEKFKIGSTIFNTLKKNTGAYHNLDARGYQTVLNYRSLPEPTNIAERVSLIEVLNNDIDFESLQDRIVLIGVTDPSQTDNWLTPYGTSGHGLGEVPGVFLQAHMISQILSAALDQRPLIWWWPRWADLLWIWIWTVIGVVIIWEIKYPWYRFLGIGSSGLIIYGICGLILVEGGWIPLIPTVLALTMASVITIVNTSASLISFENYWRTRE